MLKQLKTCDDLKRCVELEERLKNFKEVRDACYRVFEDTTSIEEMEDIIKNQWPKLYDISRISISDAHVRYAFTQLKDGRIKDREEFKRTLTQSISDIDMEYETLKDQALAADKKISDDYDQWFKESIATQKSGAMKTLYQMLAEEGIKEIIMSFIKS